MTKTETALRVIAGVSPAWAQWKMFFDTPLPKRDKVVDTAAAYQDRLSIKVRLEACRWLAGRLDATHRQAAPWPGAHNGCDYLAYKIDDEGTLFCNKCGFHESPVDEAEHAYSGAEPLA